MVVSTQFNATEALWTSKFQIENSNDAVSCRPDHDLIYGVECANQANTGLYVAGSANSTPINLTTLGNLYVGIMNTGAYTQGVPLGELWVTYDVSLRRPRIDPNIGGLMHFTGKCLTTQSNTGYSNLTSQNTVTSGLIPGLAISGSATQTTIQTAFPIGVSYLVVASCWSSNSSFPGVVTVQYGGCTVALNLVTDSIGTESLAGSSSPGAQTSVYVGTVYSTSPTQTLSFLFGAMAGTSIYGMDIFYSVMSTSSNTSGM